MPTGGRFITEDPIRDGLNWYGYCAGNPVMRVDPEGLSYDEVIKALEQIYNAKRMMNQSPSGSWLYDQAYKLAMQNKGVIENSDVYIEDWGGLRGTLSPIINGNNNSLEKIYRAKELVSSAKAISNNKDFWDDIIFLGAGTAILAPITQVISGIISALSIPEAIAIGTSFGNLGTLVNNPNISVDWSSTTMHAIERMEERGVTRQMVEQFLDNGKVLQQTAEKYIYISQQGAAVITNAGKLITAYSEQYFDEAMQQIVNKLFQ